MPPTAERGFHVACEDLSPSRRLLVYPGEDRWPGANGVEVIGLDALCRDATSHS